MLASDLEIGAFGADAQWVVVPEQMPWRAGIDELRARSGDRVPELVRVRRIPPGRAFLVSFRLARAVLPWFIRHRKDRTSPEALTYLASRLRPAFESLGAAYLKLGQVIASAEGMLPVPLVEEFKLCRDRVPPETYDHVRRVVEEDFGKPLDAVFASFSRQPIASASIAQVHAATLLTGEAVVVKVQRPDIDEVVSKDIAVMAWLAPIIEKRNEGAIIANLSAYIELFAETIVEELDFRLEAQNMLDVARVLAATEQRALVVPRPHPELVTRRILVMERIEGHSIDDASALEAAGISTTEVFRALMVSFAEGALIHGVFHGDLHGGNMLVTPEGTPALLDFGITGRFSAAKRKALLGLVVHSMAQDGRALLECFRELGGFPPDADLDEVARDINIDELLRQNPGALTPDDIAKQQRELLKRLVAHGARLPKELYLYVKGSVYLNGAIIALAADVDMFSEMGHIIELFAAQHAEQVEADTGLDITDLDTDELTAQMRNAMGIEGEGITYREMHELQNERNAAVREAHKRL
jgi:ubiquinone biosynthesis protein